MADDWRIGGTTCYKRPRSVPTPRGLFCVKTTGFRRPPARSCRRTTKLVIPRGIRREVRERVASVTSIDVPWLVFDVI